MSISELALLLLYGATGFFLTLGIVTGHPKLQVHSIFAIENRWGKLLVGVVLLAFVIMRVVQWLNSPDPYIKWVI